MIHGVRKAFIAIVAILAGSSAVHANKMMKPGTVMPGITPTGGSYLDFGVQVSGGSLCWVESRVRSTGDLVYFSGILLDGNHVLSIDPETHAGTPLDVLRIGTGNNYFTAPGNVRNITSVITNPNPVYDASVFTIDGTALTVPTLVPALPPAMFDPVKFAGFGAIGTYEGASADQDGNVRGGESIMAGNFPLFDPAIYISMFVSGFDLTERDFPAVGLFGDSGGIVKDADGHFIGQIKASNAQAGGTSTIFRKNTPEFVAWYTSAIPEPAGLMFFVLAAGLLRRRA